MKPLITVIIPVYNGAMLISQCLNALHEQTFEHFVCYVINDGSTDQTYNTVKTITQYDPRFKIINKVHAGTSSARNQGLYNVHTKYLCFLDCNDIPLPNMLEKLYNMAEDVNADIAIANFAYSNNYDENSKKNESNLIYKTLTNIQAINHMLLGQEISTKMPCKLFKYSNIADVFFDERIHINEDALFLLSAFRRASIVLYSEETVNIRKNFDHPYPKGSAGKRRLSSLNASLYIMRGLNDLDVQTQLNGVYYTVNNALKVALDLYSHKTPTAAKAKKLSSNIC
ncbi:MAG: glycosyltransferase family 2 protein, partial [Christensenellaceae bacterium]|nr:glycosyltransferase family 2 protein [Christensenellaceae bacterium]